MEILSAGGNWPHSHREGRLTKINQMCGKNLSKKVLLREMNYDPLVVKHPVYIFLTQLINYLVFQLISAFIISFFVYIL